MALGDFAKTGDIVQLRVADVAAAVRDMEWSFKQTYFPYLSGAGRADVSIAGGTIALDLSLRRMKPQPAQEAAEAAPPRQGQSQEGASPSPQPQAAAAASAAASAAAAAPAAAPAERASAGGDGSMHPRLVATHLSVTVQDLALTFKNSLLSSLYNLLVRAACAARAAARTLNAPRRLHAMQASLFADAVREYLVSALTDMLQRNLSVLLDAASESVRPYWPAVLPLVGVQLDSLPEYVADAELSTVRRAPAPPAPSPASPHAAHALRRRWPRRWRARRRASARS